jgi:hypothetical protein
MKQLETDSRRGGSARQVHQKYIGVCLGTSRVIYPERSNVGKLVLATPTICF